MRTSKSFGALRPLKPHLLQQTGGIAAEIKDVRDDVDIALQGSEGRVGFPELDWLNPGTLLAVGQATFVLEGQNLLQGQTFDTLTKGTGNAAVTVTCLKPGDSEISLAIVQGAGALGVAFASGLLTVTLAAAGSTATAVAAAVNALPACVGVILAVAGGTGGDNVLVATVAPLTGGTGYYAGNKILVSGVEALPKHAAGLWTDTEIQVTVPDLTALVPARAATDIVAVVVQVNGIQSLQLGAVLT